MTILSIWISAVSLQADKPSTHTNVKTHAINFFIQSCSFVKLDLSLCFPLSLDNHAYNQNNDRRSNKAKHINNYPKIEWCRIQGAVVSIVINNGIDYEAKEQQGTQSIAHSYTADFLHKITLLC